MRLETSGLVLDKIKLDMAKNSLGVLERYLVVCSRHLATGRDEPNSLDITPYVEHEVVEALKAQRKRLLEEISAIEARMENAYKMYEDMLKQLGLNRRDIP